MKYITDRSAITTDWECGMKYWWERCEGGVGVVPITTPDALREGIDIHEDLANLNEGRGVRGTLESMESGEVTDEVALELLTRRIGLSEAYSQFILPHIHEHFEIIAVEHEITLDRDPLWIPTTVDLLLRSKSSGRLRVWDFKTAKWFGKSWTEHWVNNVQLNILLKAVEEEFGERPDYATVVGIYKGETRKGRLSHPYVYGYEKDGVWESGWKRGWEQRGVWGYEGGMKEWVEKVGREVALEKIFIFSAPNVLHEPTLDDMLRVRLEREEEIAAIKDIAQEDWGTRTHIFEQRFTKCTPSFGPPCPYRECCFDESIRVDPIGSGLYVNRTPHHGVTEENDE